MKKQLTIFILFLFLSIPLSLLAQVPDTVLVPFQDAIGPKDALTRCIIGDTTATGQRKNINRVYRLQRGAIYYLTGRVYADNFSLKLIADDDETKCPPVIAPFPLADGSIPRITIQVSKDAYFKNIYFQGYAATGVRNTSDRPLAMAGESTKLTVDHCIIDNSYLAGIANTGNKTSLYIKDCLFRNVLAKYMFKGTTFYNYAASPMDTISIVNTTVFNGDSYFLCNSRQYAKYIRAEHNTVFMTLNNPFYVPYVSNAHIKNNIFYSVCANGETAKERKDGYYDWDNERECIFSIDTIPTDMATTYGITDANRRVIVTNNAYAWPKQITDWWAANDTVDAPLWMNDRTKAFFDNDAQYPNLIEKNNINIDPGFNSDVMKLADSLYRYVTDFRKAGSAREFYYNPAGGSLFPSRWPIPENLAYTNTTVMNGSDDSYPLGDLNWFPEKKKQWENRPVTGVEKNEAQNIPTAFNLDQNYPNPFNPTTIISFQLPKSGMVSLKVYDVLGREVATLVNQAMDAGSQKISFNANGLTSGMYFYKLKCDNFTSVKKMMLMK